MAADVPRRPGAGVAAALALGVCLALLLAASPARAQTVLTGHYQPLFASGLNSGILPTRTGPIYQNSTLFYNSTTLRDRNGGDVTSFDEINIWANRNTLLWITKAKVLGADYAAGIALPFANLAPNAVVVDNEELTTDPGLTDVPLVPIALGWHWTDWHLKAGYTLFLPVGRFELGGSNNTGKGFWTHMFDVAFTWRLPVERPWSVSLMTRYEIHSNQDGRDVRPGDTLTLEWGVGKQVGKRTTVGVVGHQWRQVTDTTGADATDPQRFRSNGLGLEVGYPLSKRFFAKARVGHDFGARNVSEGPFVILEFNFPL